MGRGAPTSVPGEPQKRRTSIGFILILVFAALVFLTLGIMGAVALFMIISTNNSLSIVNFTLQMNPEWIFENTLPTSDYQDYIGFGSLQIDASSNQISYTIQVSIPMGDTITFLSIHGPTTSSNPKTASVFLPTNGNSLDISTATSGVVSGTLVITRQQANNMIQNPQNFYMLFATTDFPAGAFGCRLGVLGIVSS